MIGSNGRPVILNSVKYKVDAAALAQYAASDAAIRNASSDETEIRAGITERDLIGRFLKKRHLRRKQGGHMHRLVHEVSDWPSPC